MNWKIFWVCIITSVVMVPIMLFVSWGFSEYIKWALANKWETWQISLGFMVVVMPIVATILGFSARSKK